LNVPVGVFGQGSAGAAQKSNEVPVTVKFAPVVSTPLTNAALAGTDSAMPTNASPINIKLPFRLLVIFKSSISYGFP